MGIELYDSVGSPPCRAVKFTLKALKIKYKIHDVDFMNKEHLSEDYLKMNPQHTFPVLNDNGFILSDSHAINAYLVNKYGEADDPLYPKDVQKRAIVDQRLHFDCGVLFSLIRQIVLPILRYNETQIDPRVAGIVEESYEFVEKFLAQGTKYIAADHITIADFSFVTSLTTLNLYVPEIKKDKYPLLSAYLDRCKSNLLGYHEINMIGLEKIKEIMMIFKVNLPPYKP